MKIIGAEPYSCANSSKNVILELFEDDVITDDIVNPIKIVKVIKCTSYGSFPACGQCPKDATSM